MTMELTKEYFDSQFKELNGRLDNMATKAELNDGLNHLQHKMEDYTNSVAETIIDAIDDGFAKVDKRLTRLESVKQI